MRKKTEILAKIKQVRTWRDRKIPATTEQIARHKQAANLIILGMKYALGYKPNVIFWCIGCSIYHKNLKCPKCGGDTEFDEQPD